MRDADFTSAVPSHVPLAVRHGLPRVLVVEDIDTTRRSMCSALRANGYMVVEARDGNEGLRLLTSASSLFDAILLDLLLPQHDGWRFRAEQLGNPRVADIPTIFVTIRPLREQERDALRAQTVIQKPFQDERLIEVVASVCAGSGGGREGLRADGASGIPVHARRVPVDPRSLALFWSRRGEVACGIHAPVSSDRWREEEWAPIPRGAGRGRLIYQCQHCSGGRPIHHRSRAAASLDFP